MKCPKCKRNMKKVKYDIGSKVLADPLTCPGCKFIITKSGVLNKAIKEDVEWGLKKRSAKS